MTHAIQGYSRPSMSRLYFCCRAEADEEGINNFGGARLPHVRMILTKPLVSLVPTSDNANTLAEPRDIACHGEPDCSANACDHLGANRDASDTADPRLGAQIGVARRWNPPTSVVSFKFSGCAGASPHQTSSGISRAMMNRTLRPMDATILGRTGMLATPQTLGSARKLA
jgi:hypothetical protein